MDATSVIFILFTFLVSKVSCLFTILFAGLLWDLYKIQNTIERDSTVSDVNSLKGRLEQYMEAMQEMMLTDSAMLREEAFLCICDLLIGFSSRVSFK